MHQAGREGLAGIQPQEMEDQGIGRKYLELINGVNNEDKDTATKPTPEVLTEIMKLQQALIDKVTTCDPVSAKSEI